MSFSLDPRLEGDALLVGDLDLCRLLLMNNALFPWLILVPKREEVTELVDLSADDQQKLLAEINQASKVIRHIFQPDKLNVAALGNVVSQLHIHVVGRFKEDSAWPNPVFGQGSEAYTKEKAEKLLTDLRTHFL